MPGLMLCINFDKELIHFMLGYTPMFFKIFIDYSESHAFACFQCNWLVVDVKIIHGFQRQIN